MKKYFLIITMFSFHIIAAQTKNETNTIVVQLNGIKQQSGQVLLSLFNNGEGFPTRPEKAFKWAKAKVTSSSLIISLDGLPYGNYAIAVVQDENENEVMDTNIFGLPAEPYGFSNTAASSFSLPTFDEAKFTIRGKRDTVNIEIHP